MQQVTIIGNVGRDAVIRDTNGRRAIGFSVAVNESYKNAEGLKIESTTWYDCTLWREGNQSVAIAQYLVPGQQVLVQGKPSTRVYQSKQDGAWRASLEINAKLVELVGGKRDDSPAPSPNHPVVGGTDAPAGGTDNDLPF